MSQEKMAVRSEAYAERGNIHAVTVQLSKTVPTKYPDRSAIIEVDRPSSAYLDDAATPARGAGRAHLDVQDLGPVATGKPRLTATTDSLAAFRS